jgi:hypothetical protein
MPAPLAMELRGSLLRAALQDDRFALIFRHAQVYADLLSLCFSPCGREEWEKRTDGDSHAIPSPERPRTVEEGLSLRERIAMRR